MLKKTVRTREKFQMRMIIVNAIWKQFFEFSKFTVEENKRERYNRDDVEGLEVSYALSWSGRARSIPVFSERIG